MGLEAELTARRKAAKRTRCGGLERESAGTGEAEQRWRTRRCVATIARVLPGLDVAAVRHFCEQRVPPHALHQVRVELVPTRGAVTIVERRAPWREHYGPEWTSRGVARLRYTAKTGLWMLFWSDRNGRWHRYDLIDPTSELRALIAEVDQDPTCIFWG